jgi:type 1 glutamine amidotransferase
MAGGADFSVLVFTKTTGFRHDSIPAGIASVRSLGQRYRFDVVDTEDETVFNDQDLSKYRVVAFLNTTGEVLNPTQQAAFERFIRRGGGFVGIHSATDTEYEWPWYGKLVGAYFHSHPAIQSAVIARVDVTHASTRSLPLEWNRSDEWYNFRQSLDPTVKVLLTLDENSYSGGNMGDGHPLSWSHEYDGGRAWYTAMGHTVETYTEPQFLAHILGGIMWSAKAEVSDIEQVNVRSGYVVISPDSNSAPPNATLTYGLWNNGSLLSECSLTNQPLTVDASMFVETLVDNGRNLGVAVTNPWDNANTITITLRSVNGSSQGSPVALALQPRQQIAKFVTELFSDVERFTGSLQLQSSLPMSTGGLRFTGAVFSIAPAVHKEDVAGVPTRILNATSVPFAPHPGEVGGSRAAVFPQIAIGGGWTTQIALVNAGSGTISGRVDLFDSAGNPMPVTWNGLFQSTFQYSIPPGGALVYSPILLK